MSLDRLFKSDERPFISPVVNLNKFLSESISKESSLLNFFNVQVQPHIEKADHDEDPGGSIPQIVQDSREAFRQFMFQHGQTLEDADQVIGEGDQLLANMLENYPIDEYEITFPPKDSKLRTHKVLHNIRQQPKSSAIKNAIVGRGKYFKYREQELKRYYSQLGNRSEKDVLLTVHLLKPLNHTPEALEVANLRQRCEVKMLIRGSMPLMKLREKIFCASDFWPNYQDFEVLPADASCYFNARFPSNFMFIHDTFYVDSRQPNSSDITEPIRDFMERKSKDFGDYFIKSMENVRVIDLELRLGQPYLYLHQGSCEHLLVFTDLRLLNAGDVQKIEEFPIRLFDTISPKLCCVCKSDVAGYVVTESDRLPMSPAFFCSRCFTSFHYDNKGQRIGNFRAFHYVNHAGIE